MPLLQHLKDLINKSQDRTIRRHSIALYKRLLELDKEE